MGKKKEILFVMNNLNVGGAEKALISMLQVFDYETYNVDLLLFKKEGLFLRHVPPQVNLLPEPPNYRYFDMPFTRVIRENFFAGRWNVIFRRIQFFFAIREANNASEAEQFGWKPISKTMLTLNKKYDAAIGFLEKNPNYFVSEKVHALKKIGYIHNDYVQLQMNKEFDVPYLRKLDAIITVSMDCLQILKSSFPIFHEKFHLIFNIISAQAVRKFAVEPEFSLPPGIKILSVGRLELQKNYDLAYRAMKRVFIKHPNVTWCILGEGSQKEILLKKIKEDQLENRIFFCGAVENPYPYINASDIFLHTASFEGYGIVVAEAKILKKPMVLTNFNTAATHIQNGHNGIIVTFDEGEIADNLDMLLSDKELQKKFSEKLSEENWGIENEIEKLYELMKIKL